MFQIKVVEKIKTQILCSIPFSKNRAVCEIMSKNMVESERSQVTIWWSVTCWFSKVTRAQAHVRICAPTLTHTHTHTQTQIHTHKYVIHFAFPRQKWFRERAAVLRYTDIACLVIT